MITINNFSKKYKSNEIFKNLDLKISTGKVFGLMGPNGTGKTTFVKCLIKETDYKGEIIFNHQLLIKNKIDYSKLFLLKDKPFVYNYLTGAEFIDFYLGIKNLPTLSKIDMLDALSVFDLSEEDSDKLIKNYSFGMKRKLQLVAGFLSKPLLVILDEPNIGLDLSSRIQLKKLIQKNSKSGTSFVISSHDASFMENLCDSLMILKKTHEQPYIRYDLNQNLKDEVNLEQIYIRETKVKE